MAVGCTNLVDKHQQVVVVVFSLLMGWLWGVPNLVDKHQQVVVAVLIVKILKNYNFDVNQQISKSLNVIYPGG